MNIYRSINPYRSVYVYNICTSHGCFAVPHHGSHGGSADGTTRRRRKLAVAQRGAGGEGLQSPGPGFR